MPFQRGDRLITAGADSDEVLLVESGLVKVVLLARDGTESIVGLLGRGTLLGEAGVMGCQPRGAHIVALVAGRAVHLAGSTFLRLCNEDEGVRGLVDHTWRKRQQDADYRQLTQTRDVSTRVAMYLLRWARDLGGKSNGGLLLRGPSQRDIAQAISASEKSVEAALALLRGAGLLKTSRLTYLLTKPEALEQQLAEPNP